MDKTTVLTDFQFFAKIMPNYFVTCDQKPGREVWRCRSNTGIPDEEKFDLIVKAFKQRWPGRYVEVNHTVCTNHADFDIVLKNEHAWDGPVNKK